MTAPFKAGDVLRCVSTEERIYEKYDEGFGVGDLVTVVATNEEEGGVKFKPDGWTYPVSNFVRAAQATDGKPFECDVAFEDAPPSTLPSSALRTELVVPVCGTDYAIEVRDGDVCDEDENAVYGITYEDSCQIVIDARVAPQRLWAVKVHELGHAVGNESGFGEFLEDLFGVSTAVDVDEKIQRVFVPQLLVTLEAAGLIKRLVP